MIRKIDIYVYKTENKHPRGCTGQNLDYFLKH